MFYRLAVGTMKQMRPKHATSRLQYVHSTDTIESGKIIIEMVFLFRNERKKQKFLAKKYEPFVEYSKKLLFEKVTNVVISNRLTKEPCVVVADTYGHSSFMDKIQKAQMDLFFSCLVAKNKF